MNKYANPYSDQKFLILEHFLTGRSITQVEAEAVYKIRRLAARIAEMKADGWNIARELRKDLMGQKYARYSLKRPFKLTR